MGLAGSRFPFGMMKVFWDYRVLMVAHIMNVLTASELHMLKWLR